VDYAEAVREFLEHEVLARRQLPAQVASLGEEAGLPLVENQAGAGQAG
jgi:hypothetical protein